MKERTHLWGLSQKLHVSTTTLKTILKLDLVLNNEAALSNWVVWLVEQSGDSVMSCLGGSYQALVVLYGTAEVDKRVSTWRKGSSEAVRPARLGR